MWPSDRFVIAYVALEQKSLVTPDLDEHNDTSVTLLEDITNIAAASSAL